MCLGTESLPHNDSDVALVFWLFEFSFILSVGVGIGIAEILIVFECNDCEIFWLVVGFCDWGHEACLLSGVEGGWTRGAGWHIWIGESKCTWDVCKCN